MTSTAAARPIIALVTGATRGIGRATVRAIAARAGEGSIVLLGARDPGAGALVAAEEEVTAARKGAVRVRSVTLDVTNEASVAAAVETVQRKYGRVDVLVQNAGVLFHPGMNPELSDAEVTRRTFETNFHGVRRVAHRFLPLLQLPTGNAGDVEAARMVLLGAQVARAGMRAIPEAERELYLGATADEAFLVERARAYLAEVEAGSRAGGAALRGTGPATPYTLSKICAMGFARSLGHRVWEASPASGRRAVLVHACDPGWVRSDMGGPKAPASVDDGAATPAFLALDAAAAPPAVTAPTFWTNKQSPIKWY